MKESGTIVADGIFILHLCVATVLLVGWGIPEIRLPYLALLYGWPLCWALFGYCPLSKLEFELRGLNIKPEDLNGEFATYYFKKFFGIHLKPRVVFQAGIAVFFILFLLTLR